jgi:hypothetical protein
MIPEYLMSIVRSILADLPETMLHCRIRKDLIKHGYGVDHPKAGLGYEAISADGGTASELCTYDALFSLTCFVSNAMDAIFGCT